MAAQATEKLARPTARLVREALYRRLFKGGTSERSVGGEINKWLKDSRRFKKWDVGKSVKDLRKRKLFNPALKLLETATRRGMNLTVSDQAIHLDLISKTKGIVAAEKYFMDLPEPSKNHLSYGALLNCYCKEKMTENAEALLEKMKELNFASSPMEYNSLMTLYSETGKPEKIPAVIQDMKANEVMPDVFSYNVWMRSLAAVGDIPGVERVLDEMKRDGRVGADWTTYSNLASIYVDAGMNDKAEKALKELENRMDLHCLPAFQYLITLYGRTGNLVEVYRVWRSLKLAFPKTVNLSYLNMIQVLVKLGDISGAENCFKEWEAGCSTYDIRLPNVLIGAYAKANRLRKAEAMRERARKRGAAPNTKTWEIFADYYLRTKQIDEVVKCIENAISASRKSVKVKWLPTKETVEAVMTYFEEQKDVDGAENFFEILKKVECVDSAVYESLIRTYFVAGKNSPAMRRRLKMENIEVAPEAEKLLDTVCSQ
ncbi:pentatricopeptide repeat-containing protein At1g60770 [Nymphaea colorata]|nr:pentatricopeptide repeat-containing protein At1g60770 [Nymphaea colorata]